MKVNVKVDLDFLDYCKFILNFSGVDSLYEITDEAIEALHKAYPKVKFKGRIDGNLFLELEVGITEDECYGYLNNRLVDEKGNIIKENTAICSGMEEDYRNISFDLSNGNKIEIYLKEGASKVNSKSGEVSEVVGEKSTKRMSLF